MVKARPSTYPQPSSEFSLWLDDIDHTLETLALNNTQPYDAACAAGLQPRLRDHKYQELLAMVHTARPDMSAEEMVRNIRTSLQAGMLCDPEFNYPSPDYLNPKKWQRAHHRMDNPRHSSRHYERDMTRHTQFLFNHFRRLSTTVSRRSVTFKFLGLALQHHIGEAPEITDIGSGSNEGNMRLLLNQQFPYEPPEAIRFVANEAPIPVPWQSEIIAGIVGTPYAPRRIVGSDIMDPNEDANMRWIRACPTAGEIATGEWSQIHDALYRAELGFDKLGFVRADFAESKDVGKVRAELSRPDGTADMTTTSVSWYQGTAAERRAKFKNAVRITRPGSFAVFQEFAVRNRRSDTYLEVMDVWNAMHVYGYQVDTGELHHLLTYDSGRTRRMQVQPALARLATGGPYEQEVRDLAVYGS